MIDPGKFNKPIEIGIITDGFSEETGRDEGEETFSLLRPVYARVSHVKTSEHFQAAAVNAEKTVTFTIRYQPDMTITENNVIRYGGLLYDIKSVSDPLEAHETLIIIGEVHVWGNTE